MDLGLEDKIAVVLASTSGIGLASAEALLAEGARVAISGRERVRLENAMQRLGARFGERVLGEAVDVTDPVRLQQHIESVRARFGSPDILVTNAGGPPPRGPADLSDDDLDSAYHLTLKSAIAAIRLVLPDMRAKKWGRIIGLTSLSVRQPIPSLALSSTMRAGLTGYLKSLATEVARDGVLVNSVCTGLFATERIYELIEVRAKQRGHTLEEESAMTLAEIPLGRLGQPAEFGAMVAFLASERASYLTGIALPLDGGFSRALI